MLQRRAGNRESAAMLQRFRDTPSGLWSNRRHYVVGHERVPADSPLARLRALGIAAGAQRPQFAGTEWRQTGAVTSEQDEQVPTYQLHWQDHGQVKIPKDCLTTAELVAAWLEEKDPEVVGEVKKVPGILRYIPRGNANIALTPGEILFHVHDAKDEGQFHGAAIIAADEPDVVTMESDASRGSQIVATNPLFDMYEGRSGFEGSQHQEGGTHERTYVISFVETPKARSPAETLWAGVMDMQLSGPATTAAQKIKAAIQQTLSQPSAGKAGAESKKK